jgi:soluble lytic murein transglycosylase
VTKTRQRFAGSATETNAMFAALRLYVAESEWSNAIQIAEELSQRNFARAVDTSRAEVAYLRAFSLEKAGRKEEAFKAYLAIPDGVDSYYGWLATERLPYLNNTANTVRVDDRIDDVNRAIAKVADAYPAPYRQTILNAAKARKLDPRFILALIRQESVFKPQAKSPAGARGLLQLTMDAAQKYGPGAGLNALRENQLYQPETSITVGAEYIEHLSTLFPGMLEPIAASYNGGEDNVARWLERSKRNDPGVFTAEVGFEETKGYVQKVMSNYRVYKKLYTPDLIRK